MISFQGCLLEYDRGRGALIGDGALIEKRMCYPWCLLEMLGVLLEAGYWRSTDAYFASHCQLLNFTLKRLEVVISSTETGRHNYESLYFIL